MITINDGSITVHAAEIKSLRQALLLAGKIYKWANEEAKRRKVQRKKDELVQRKMGRPPGRKDGE